MVTWLHFWIMSILSMGLAVTDMVTNGYIGYIKKSGYNKSARQGRFVVLRPFSYYLLFSYTRLVDGEL